MRNPWRLINKCVICGTRLVFEYSTEPNRRKNEGIKKCEQNHEPFTVTGRRNEIGTWRFEFSVPGGEQ